MNRNPFDPHAPAPHPYTLLSFTVSSGQAIGSKKQLGWQLMKTVLAPVPSNARGGEKVNLEQLVSCAKDGDDDAFFQLVSLHKEQLYKIAYAFLRNETDALEAIQEATCRSYLKLARLKQPAYFRTWLTRILIHICLDEQKRRKRIILDPMEEDVQSRASIPMDDQNVERIQIEEALARLNPNYRHIIILKYFEDRTIRDIAEVLGHPEGTIKTWLHKALGALRKDLGKGW